MTDTEQKFESWLHSRSIKQPSADFADRIILAARSVEQKKPFDLTAWLNGVFAEISPARPAYAFATVVMLGLLIGYGNTPMDENDSPESPGLQAFLYDEGDTL